MRRIDIMMKKVMGLAAMAVLAGALVTGCGNKTAETTAATDAGVTTEAPATEAMADTEAPATEAMADTEVADTEAPADTEAAATEAVAETEAE